MSKTTSALDTLHHYLKLAGDGQTFNNESSMRELSDAIDTLKEFCRRDGGAPEGMRSVPKPDRREPMTNIDTLKYEVGASPWARHLSWKWAQSLATCYYAWKVNRKWARAEPFLRATKL